MSRRDNLPDQLGFDALLAHAEQDNLTRQIARECAHLPGGLDEAVPFLRALIGQHHAAMLAGDAVAVMRLRDEARHLATKLNDFRPGILAGPDAPGCMLERLTQAPAAQVPLWGQTGSFEIAVAGMRVRVEMEGVFGIASDLYHWPGFAAHAVERDQPFLSETSFRSFLPISGALKPGFTPDSFAHEVIAGYVWKSLRSRLCAIEPRRRVGVPI